MYLLLQEEMTALQTSDGQFTRKKYDLYSMLQIIRFGTILAMCNIH